MSAKSKKRDEKPPVIFSNTDGLAALLSGGDASPDTDNTLEIDKIVLSDHQPRKYFDDERISSLATSIEKQGILQPLIVRPINNGLYELVAGERRLRAAKQLGLETVPVLIKQLDELEAKEVALLENLQRNDLNPIEETEGVLNLLCMRLSMDREAIITLLNQAAHPERASVDNVVHSEKWEKIQGFFSSLGRLTPESFRTHRLPLLKLPKDILEVLRQGKIEYTKARVIAKIKDEDVRQQILQTAIDENLSLVRIKEKIKDINSDNNPVSSSTLKDSFKKTVKDVTSSKKWDNPKHRKKFERLLNKFISEAEKLLSEE